MSEAHFVGKLFICSELAEKVALALRGEVGANVVRPQRGSWGMTIDRFGPLFFTSGSE